MMLQANAVCQLFVNLLQVQVYEYRVSDRAVLFQSLYLLKGRLSFVTI